MPWIEWHESSARELFFQLHVGSAFGEIVGATLGIEGVGPTDQGAAAAVQVREHADVVLAVGLISESTVMK